MKPRRKPQIGASQIAAIFGLHAFLKHDAMVRQIRDGEAAPETSPQMAAGIQLQAIAVDKLSQITGQQWREWPQEKHLNYNEWLRVTPDTEAAPILADIKITTSAWDSENDYIGYVLQCHAQLVAAPDFTSNNLVGFQVDGRFARAVGRLVIAKQRAGKSRVEPVKLTAQVNDLIAGTLEKPTIIPVPRNQRVETLIKNVGEEFYQKFIDDDGDPAAWVPPKKEMLEALLGVEAGTETRMSEAVGLRVQMIEKRKVAIEALEAQIKQFRSEIETEMGPFEHGVLPDGRIVSFGVRVVEPFQNKGYSKRILTLPRKVK